jgi:histidine ammonia-lyase
MGSFVLDGQGLTPAAVAVLALEGGGVTAQTAARARAAQSAQAAQRITRVRPVYGRTTGVGANRVQAVQDEGHGLRLLRSHAGGIGAPVPVREVRAMLLVRTNQLLAGGAGLRPEIIDAMIDALTMGALPEIREYGGLGTADLTALAELGLTLAGERPWRQASGPAPIPIESADALALISSSALTIGQATLTWHEARNLIQSAHTVAALSFVALNGSTEAYAEAVHRARPYEGSTRSAKIMRLLLQDHQTRAARIQDPFALRCVPQVHGAALDACANLERVLTTEVNAAAENPLISAAEETVYHHGNFHQAYLTQALDALNLALLSAAHLSTARLNMLYEPEFTGLRAFLADGAPASSGLMILENAAHAALADLRNAAMPAALGHATLSRGVEDHTPFTAQAARQAKRAVTAFRLVLASELVATAQALRLREATPSTESMLGRESIATKALRERTGDLPTSEDVDTAMVVLDELRGYWD